MVNAHIEEIYKKIIKHSDYLEGLSLSIIEANSMPSQPTEQYLIRSKSQIDESVLNAIFTPLESSTGDYSLNIICDGVDQLNSINKIFGIIDFKKIDELVKTYVETGLKLHLIKDVSYPSHVNFSWFYKLQSVYQSFGEYHHSIYRDYNKRLVKVSFYDAVTQKESRPLKLIANLNLTVINNVITPTVVLSIPFIKNKNRIEISINLNEPFYIRAYEALFNDEFNKAAIKELKRKT